MVEVFKTNVQEFSSAETLVKKLLYNFPAYKINFDLTDCDKILRVEGNNISSEKIMELVAANGYQLEILL
jgi:hypothetical protein